MNRARGITNVKFTPAAHSLVVTGLVGWISFRLCDLIEVDGVTVRKTANGRLTLSYPARRDRTGRLRFTLRPVSEAARRSLEHAVIQSLALQEALG